MEHLTLHWPDFVPFAEHPSGCQFYKPREAVYMLSIFKPAAHQPRVDDSRVDPLYRKLRWQIFLGIFFGYAA